MEFTGHRANLARKFSMVVRDFPPGCGTRASECKREEVPKRKFLSTAEVVKRLPEKRLENPAKEVTAVVTYNPGLVASSSSRISGDRERVLETLQKFRAICKELALEKRASLGQKEKITRIDLKAWNKFKEKEGYAHGNGLVPGVVKKRKDGHKAEPLMGGVPGVEIGDKFYYRVELKLVGLHRHFEAGIDYTKEDGDKLVTSIIASSNADDMNNADELTYVGEGGISTHDKFHEDQKLVRGNRAMKNSIRAQNPIRVMRKVTASVSDRELITSTHEVYVYDGLYVAQSYRESQGDHGRLIFKFKLKRIPGQPPIARYRG
ncbi:histone-lysine N-methyltransferase, H3 lysine-9 specific SUVH5-like [Punica granatum]|uniref:YDG domain-containing protein n=2 Tax=Punica granatum TaxID=22663 RepID=A0A218W9E8_PUNGR|nr:histone-lysine N-methyltransferase, H3 lysine-9 specific SUVH5-like [Punica granatum]OWM69109.1 hypothetical protein CDL15_Pgr025296 [Punica granatum]PKI57811.1 hypothetical protein CRG98_021878 [Punica granatum]